MECKEFLERLEKLIGNTEDGIASGVDSEHLRRCPECRGVYEAHLATGRQLRGLPRITAPAGFTRSVLEQVEWRERRRVFQCPVPGRRMLLIAAAVLLLVLVPINTLLNQSRPYFSLSGEDSRLVLVEGRNLVIPAGVVVRGNIEAVNGHVTVLGEVEGSITLVRSVLVSGPQSQIDHVYTLDWTTWQHVAHGLSQLTQDIRAYARGIWR